MPSSSPFSALRSGAQVCHVLQQLSAGAGRLRFRLPFHGLPGRGAGEAAGAQAAALSPSASSSTTCSFSYQRRSRFTARCCATSTLRCRPGEVVAIVGSSGSGQDHARPPAAPVFRRQRRAHPYRRPATCATSLWPRCARRSASSPRRRCCLTTPCATTSPTGSRNVVAAGGGAGRARCPGARLHHGACRRATTR